MKEICTAQLEVTRQVTAVIFAEILIETPLVEHY